MECLQFLSFMRLLLIAIDGVLLSFERCADVDHIMWFYVQSHRSFDNFVKIAQKSIRKEKIKIKSCFYSQIFDCY